MEQPQSCIVILLLEFRAQLKGIIIIIIIDDHTGRHEKNLHCLARRIVFVLVEAEHVLVQKP